jgi:hypothetical protein
MQLRNRQRLAGGLIVLLVMLAGAALVSRMFHKALHPRGCMPGTVSCQ